MPKLNDGLLVPTCRVGIQCRRASVPKHNAGASPTSFPRSAWERGQLALASLEKSEALFNSLLQRAFKGELTV